MRPFAYLLLAIAYSASAQPDPRLAEDLVAANRILAHEGVLDGWGHVSARLGRERFLLSQAIAPALVTVEDLAQTLGDKPAVLMRGHGSTVVGPSIPRVVSRSIFLALNATAQQQAMALGGPITYLDPEEARLIEAREGHGLKRAWEAWKHKALAK